MKFIRPLKKQDIPALIQLCLAEGWIVDQFEFEMYVKSRLALGVAVIDKDAIIGCATIYIHQRCAWLGNLIVKSEYRNQGLGSTLMRQTLDWIDDRGGQSLLLAAAPQAESLYKRFGFKPVIPIYRWQKSMTNKQLSNEKNTYSQISRQIVDLDSACWDDNRTRLLNILNRKRSAFVLPDGSGFLMSGRVGGHQVIGPGSIRRVSIKAMDDLLDQALSFDYSSPKAVIDTFPNPLINSVLSNHGFCFKSATLLMCRGLKPNIEFGKIIAMATLGSKG